MKYEETQKMKKNIMNAETNRKGKKWWKKNSETNRKGKICWRKNEDTKRKEIAEERRKMEVVTISALPDDMWRTIAMKNLPNISNEWEIIIVALPT